VTQILCRPHQKQPGAARRGPGWARRPLSRGWPRRSRVGTCRVAARQAFDLARSGVNGRRPRSIAASSRSGSRPSWTKTARSKNIILFIDELHTIVGAGSAEGTMDASNIIKPALSRARCSALAPPPQRIPQVHREGPALERPLQSVKVEAPSVRGSMLILKGLRPKYESITRRRSPMQPRSSVKFSDRYIHRPLPARKAMASWDEAGSRARINSMTLPPGSQGY